jgi:hypothetical protein
MMNSAFARAAAHTTAMKKKQELDLFGDPVPKNWGRRGRPQHVATRKNCNRVVMLLAMRWDNARIAKALSITEPTLKKHYERELASRENERYRLQAVHMERLWEQVQAGNVSAMREWRTLMDKVESEEAERNFLESENLPPEPKRGKKEEAAYAATTAGEGTDWGNDLRGPGSRAVN